MWHRDDREEGEGKTPFVGRPRGAAWRAYQSEGVLWEGQALLVGADVDLATRLLVTNSRLGFARGGEIVLEIARSWLRPAPVMRPDGALLLSIIAAEGDERNEIVFRVRDGDIGAFQLLELLTEHRHSAATRDRDDPEPRPPLHHLPPLPDAVRSEPLSSAARESAESRAAPIAVSADDPFGFHDAPERAAPTLQRAVPGADPVVRQSPPPAALGHDRDWNLQPLKGMVPHARRRRRGWVFRLGGLILLLAAAALVGSGQMPARITDRLSERPRPTAVVQIAATDREPTPDSETLVTAAVATRDAASEIGVGGPGPMSTTIATELPPPPAQAAAPTATAEATAMPAETAPAATTASGGPETPVATAIVPAPTTRSVPARLPPTALPSPTVTLVPPTAIAGATAPAAEATASGTEAPVAVETAEPTRAVSTPPTEAATATTEATTTPPAEPSVAPPTDAKTTVTAERAPEGTQGPSVALNEIPGQAIAAGAVHFTVDVAQRGSSLPAFGLPAATDGEWVALILNARNVSDSTSDVAMANFTLRAEPSGEIVALDIGTGVIAGIVGLNPAYGSDDVIALEPEQSARLILVFLVPEETDAGTLVIEDRALDLAVALDRPAAEAEASGSEAMPELREATVTRVIDGERFEADLAGAAVEVRHLGIDTPTRDECYATEATAAHAALIEGQTIWLERERADTDVIGRLWRDVWIAGPNGERQLVAVLLVEQGAAVPDPEAPNLRYAGWIAAVASTAEADGAGLWGACQGEAAAGRDIVAAPAIDRLFALAPWRAWLRLDLR